MRAALVFALVLASVSVGATEEPAIDFGGEAYHLDYHDRAKLPDESLGDGVAEFTLKGETVNDWTKLFAYHSYPGIPENPGLAAETLGKTVKENNKDANYALTEVPKTDEAIVDFLTWAPGSDVMEFNVFKYAKAGDGTGLVALQYAQRFKADDFDVADFRSLRQRMVENGAHRRRTGARLLRRGWRGQPVASRVSLHAPIASNDGSYVRAAHLHGRDGWRKPLKRHNLTATFTWQKEGVPCGYPGFSLPP